MGKAYTWVHVIVAGMAQGYFFRKAYCLGVLVSVCAHYLTSGVKLVYNDNIFRKHGKKSNHLRGYGPLTVEYWENTPNFRTQISGT